MSPIGPDPSENSEYAKLVEFLNLLSEIEKVSRFCYIFGVDFGNP